MTYTNFTVETDADGMALVTWDMPDKSMNVITVEVMEELDRIVDQVAGDTSIKGAVITSGKKNSFSGGADLSMLKMALENYNSLKQESHEKAVRWLFETNEKLGGVFRKLETCGKPFVAAINGTCMGGAFELALACHGRVAADGDHVKIALPEVKVGIFPGAGGTQRVPRMIQTQPALEMMTTGKSYNAAKAKALGLIDEAVKSAQLIKTAKKMIISGLDPVKPWDKKGFKAPGGPVYSAAGGQLWPPAIAILRRETYGNYPAAAMVLKSVYEGLMVDFDTGLRIERRYFTQALTTPEARAMIRSLFISMQELNKGARRPADVKPTKFKKIGVIGAGFMGAGIAHVTAKAGINVVLIDRDQEAANKGKAHSEELMDKAIKRGRATEADKDALLARITPTHDYASLDGCDLVIEAVFEDSEVKRQVTEASEAQMKRGAIFASNTSTIPITALAKMSKRPKSFVGIHFFSPVDRMMLVEIILGRRTSDKALAVALDYVKAIKKTPIVVNDTRGFYVNRCVLRYMSEAYLMLQEGVPPAMIENAAKMAGMPVGPLALNDEVAIDLTYKIMQQTKNDLGEKALYMPHYELVKTMVETHGRKGRKSGAGFYDYPAKPAKKHLWPELKDLYPQQNADDLDVEVLKKRFLTTIALEAARTMAEGIVTDPREADVGSILGFGFAPYTGGALSYIDEMGVEAFVAQCKALRRYGTHFQAIKLLRDMAANGETFYGRFGAAIELEDAA